MCIQLGGNTSESFKLNSGIKQGCVLAPTLFAICIAALPLMGLRMEFTSEPGWMDLFSV